MAGFCSKYLLQRGRLEMPSLPSVENSESRGTASVQELDSLLPTEVAPCVLPTASACEING